LTASGSAPAHSMKRDF